MYKLVECKHCGKLSVHTGEHVFRCPHCGHKYKINGGTVVYQSADIHEVLDRMNELQHTKGYVPHFRRYGV